MKKILATIMVMAATPAVAEVTEDHYKTIHKKVPYTEQICELVDVPVYGNNGSNTEDVLTGAIIGGIIGNNIKGEKNGGAAGAVLGGLLGAKNRSNRVVGYRQEQQCKNITRYDVTQEQVYSHSTVVFNHNGRQYILRFQK